ncbi:NUDIX hydrolase, partial [Streptomyces thermodiastaticus]
MGELCCYGGEPSQPRGPRIVSTERPHSVSVAGVVVDDQGRALLI